MNRRYCLALDLKEDAALIKEYERMHQQDVIWPEIVESIRESGILEMEIFRTGNRLFMIIEVDEDFSFEHKAQMDASNERVREWERLMWRFQKPLPWAGIGEKWVQMNAIFTLTSS